MKQESPGGVNHHENVDWNGVEKMGLCFVIKDGAVRTDLDSKNHWGDDGDVHSGKCGWPLFRDAFG